ncbi:AEC family transporter [Alkalihalobacillus oceani]|uniref:AEC family transporter n=1 Tax=Halalkalibacter oceani TaxID=1653776 RepID=UPI0020416ABF|nr:AEC family transporter [Halalkalibacter oceani]
MGIFFEVIVPVLLVFAVGFVLQKTKKIDTKAISTLVVYIFMPCLVFRTLYTTEVTVQYVYLIAFSLLLLTLTIVTVKLYAKIRKLPSSVESGLILSTSYMNAGNYGSPIILFAYGTTAFDYAISFYILSSILLNSVGLYYAARGNMNMKLAVKAVFTIPAIYAVFAAALVKLFHLQLPENIFSMVSFVADASIPCVMVILGMQLAQIKVKSLQWEYISFATVMKLVVAPLFAFGLTQLFTMDPLLQKVLILTAAMPTASAATIFAVQFNAEAKLVSGTTFITTLVSILTITVLISIL